MKPDTPQPSTSVTKQSYAAAGKKNTAKKAKTSTKGKTPFTPSSTKPFPKKPVKSQLLTKPSATIVEEVADYDTSETTSCPKTDAMSTLSQLIPLIQKNWSNLFEVAASMLPNLLKC
ncbi:hypothetical protein Trydic_g22568 [Trypoxylus dichotomus]